MITASMLKEIRRQKGITQEDLSKISGVSTLTIGKFEGEKTKPYQDTLDKLERAIKIIGSSDFKKENENVKEFPKQSKKRVELKQKLQEGFKRQPQKYIEQLSTPNVKAIIKYTIVAEALLDVNEEIISKNPLTTQRIYTNPKQTKVISTNLETDYEIVRIISENIISEPMPAYV